MGFETPTRRVAEEVATSDRGCRRDQRQHMREREEGKCDGLCLITAVAIMEMVVLEA